MGAITLWRRAAVFVLGSFSVGSLLLYFLGVGHFGVLCGSMLAIEVAGLCWLARDADTRTLLLSSLWAGTFATLAYDAVRVPIVHSGIPVFKAISYFGTIFTGASHPTLASEAAGWLYHLSNGVSFGLMYAFLASRPGPVTAAMWGLALEGAMLLTPYAEVFGYRRDARFMAITISSHIVYGLVLWLGLREGARSGGPRMRPVVVYAVSALALGAIAMDFHRLNAAKLPQSPPAYVGSHLYTTWSTPEPDRVAAMWILKKWVDPAAEFYIVEPFEKVLWGRPFDTPDAEIRRSGTRSATEELIAARRVAPSAKLDGLARMTNLAEISPWMLASEPNAEQLVGAFRENARSVCGPALRSECLATLFQTFDNWFEKPEQGQGTRSIIERVQPTRAF